MIIKLVFKEDCLENSTFKNWLVKGNNSKQANCRRYNKSLELSNLGRQIEYETVTSKEIIKPSSSKKTLELAITKWLKFKAEIRCALHCDEWISLQFLQLNKWFFSYNAFWKIFFQLQTMFKWDLESYLMF